MHERIFNCNKENNPIRPLMVMTKHDRDPNQTQPFHSRRVRDRDRDRVTEKSPINLKNLCVWGWGRKFGNPENYKRRERLGLHEDNRDFPRSYQKLLDWAQAHHNFLTRPYVSHCSQCRHLVLMVSPFERTFLAH